mgnify:CR=1 FL=1
MRKRLSPEHDLANRTVAMLVMFATRRGHLAQRVTNEGRGNCPSTHCTPACHEYGNLLESWTKLLNAMNDAEQDTAPDQPALFAESAT